MDFKILEFKIKDQKFPLILNASVDEKYNVTEGDNFLYEQSGKWDKEEIRKKKDGINHLGQDLMVYFETARSIYNRGISLGIDQKDMESILPKFVTIK